MKTANSGAVSMLTILILSMIIMEISLVGLLSAYFSGEQGLGSKAANLALYAARSGNNDVRMHIIRDRTYVPSPNPYTITLDNGSVSVEVTRTVDGNHIIYTIASTGSSGPKRIKVVETVTINDDDGSIINQLVEEGGI